MEKELKWIKSYWIIVIILSALSVINAFVIDPLIFIDVFVLGFCGYFIYKEKQWAGIVALCWVSIDKILRFPDLVNTPIILVMVIAIIAVCVRGTMALGRVKKLTVTPSEIIEPQTSFKFED